MRLDETQGSESRQEMKRSDDQALEHFNMKRSVEDKNRERKKKAKKKPVKGKEQQSITEVKEKSASRKE